MKLPAEVFRIFAKLFMEGTLENLITDECRRCKAPGPNLSGKRIE